MKNLFKLLGLSLVIAFIFAACSKEEKAAAKEAPKKAEKKMDAMPKEEKLAYELVSEDDQVASAIGYKHDINQADKAKYKMWKAENTCNKCMHYVEVKNPDGSVSSKQGRCKLIATTMAPGGPTVASGGWCSVWAAKPA